VNTASRYGIGAGHDRTIDAAGNLVKREKEIEMTKAIYARVITSVGSVVALAAVVGAGTKWW
jgi:hypothetical protein